MLLITILTVELKIRRLDKLVITVTDVLAMTFTRPIIKGFGHVDVALRPIQVSVSVYNSLDEEFT